MSTWIYKQPVRIVFGNGKLHCLKDEISALNGKNGLLVTSPSFVKRGIADGIIEECDGVIKQVFSSVSPNPDVRECDECAKMLREGKCDFVVALGGGSVMDCAKAAAMVCLTEHEITDFLTGKRSMPSAHLPLIAVPTTAGTGSEITSVSVLTNHELGLKAPISADCLYPTMAIVDPELTYSVSPFMTACTGFDVLCHSLEAYWSIHHQPVCDALAIPAARMVLDNLETAYNEPLNKVARENMAQASCMAGLAFALPKTTSAHACSYPLTNLLGIPHGEACALTIDHFIRFNATSGCKRTMLMAQQLGFKDAFALADEISRMKKVTGMLIDLKEFNLTDDRLEQLVQASKHPNLLNNPVTVPEDFLREMYSSMR